MDYKFIQPVSMRVTEEQYKRDLREPLLKMGYKEVTLANFNKMSIIATNYNGYYRSLSNLNDMRKSHYNRYFIPDYNPELFLAIAAMTDSISPIAGEWIVYTDSMAEMCGLTAGELYRIGKLNTNTKYMRKATLQELIDKFTNKETIKESVMKIEVTTKLIEELKGLIAPENEEKFNKLIGIEKPMFREEDFITGDKVILRNGKTYLVIRDCNAGCYGAQVFVLVRCDTDGGFMNSDEYNEKLLHNGGSSRYDIMKIYRCEEGRIKRNSFSLSLNGFKLIWERE